MSLIACFGNWQTSADSVCGSRLASTRCQYDHLTRVRNFMRSVYDGYNAFAFGSIGFPSMEDNYYID